jgi:hypothetical protein
MRGMGNCLTLSMSDFKDCDESQMLSHLSIMGTLSSMAWMSSWNLPSAPHTPIAT